jgi:hypothetical protein
LAFPSTEQDRRDPLHRGQTLWTTSGLIACLPRSAT